MQNCYLRPPLNKYFTSSALNSHLKIWNDSPWKIKWMESIGLLPLCWYCGRCFTPSCLEMGIQGHRKVPLRRRAKGSIGLSANRMEFLQIEYITSLENIFWMLSKANLKTDEGSQSFKVIYLWKPSIPWVSLNQRDFFPKGPILSPC